ncbi:MAG TPA: hypothetical protein VFS40_05200 [Gemmatimonadales bacterium]|nr:hypothetical protein [Gemmatimonadales bacterium]
MHKSIREARLRPEYAALYPYLHAGIWAPAARMAAAIIERVALTGLPRGVDPDARIMSDEHFEFRSGDPEARERPFAGRMTFRDCLAPQGGSGAAAEGSGGAFRRSSPSHLS